MTGEEQLSSLNTVNLVTKKMTNDGNKKIKLFGIFLTWSDFCFEKSIVNIIGN